MRRSQLALALALVAVAASAVGAIGPADDVRTTYSWPPRQLPVQSPSTVWHAPLMLLRPQPESISATIDCSLPEPLPESGRQPTVVATTRSPEDGGLFVTRDVEGLLVSVGGERIGRIAVPRDPGDESECAYRLDVRDRQATLDRGAGDPTRWELGAMPVVHGLFSELDLRTPTAPSIEITTAAHGSRPSFVQKVAWVLAALAIVAALVLVVVDSGGPRVRRPTLPPLHPADAAVAAVLLAWWLLGPAFIDDGWIVARERTFAASGGFSNYFDTLGANVPLGYWLEWTQHWLTERASTVLVLRLPALLCLGATWLLCRWVLGRALGPAPPASVVWALAAASLVGALAWGMTLRPEPVIALLVTSILACTIVFLERETAGPLAAVAVLVPLTLAAHHTGVVALAPLLAIAPALVSWARGHLAAAGTIVTAAVASLIVLAFVGADAGQRLSDARTYREITSTETAWRDELLRYARLSEFPNATPLRRLSVVLLGLAVFAFLLRRERARRALLDLPAAALGLGLLLLIATPSKWGWHFGALLGLAALAIACETARLRDDAARARGWDAWPLVALGAVAVGAAWAWSPRSAWNRLDLRELDWTPGFEARVGMTKLAVLVPLALVAGSAAVELLRRRRDRLPTVPWRAAAWSAPALALPALVFTLAVLVADSAKAEGWTLTRQNLDSLRGRSGCGLADDLRVVDPDSLRPLSALTPLGDSVPSWVPPPPRDGVPRFLATRRSPWFAVPDDGRFGVYVATAPATEGGELALAWGRRVGARIERLGSSRAATLLPSEAATESAVPAWSFLGAEDLPAPPGAEVVAIAGADGPGELAATAPVRYGTMPLRERIEGASPTLVVPELFLYLPCARQPVLRDGAVEPPGLLVSPFEGTSWLRTWETSPFESVLDLYPVGRLSLPETPNPPAEFAVLTVDMRIPGAVTAAPERATAG